MDQDFKLHAPNIARMLMIRGYQVDPKSLFDVMEQGHAEKSPSV